MRAAVESAFEFWRYSVGRTAGVLTALALAHLACAVLGPTFWGAVMALVGGLLWLMADGALLRLAFADEHLGDREFRLGPSGFQWGRAEGRLLAAALLMLFLFGLGLLFLFVLSFICSGVALVASGAHGLPEAADMDPNTLPPALRRTVTTLADLYAVVCVWVGVRVCLAPAATVAEKRVMVFSTWGLTRGQFWRILACVVAVLAPTFVLTFLLANLAMPRALFLVLSLALAVVNVFLELPLLFGLLAYLYRGLRPQGTLAASPTPGAGLAGV